jgi:hypothetical protein
MKALIRRARWSAVLPELRLRAARATDETLRLTPTLDDPYRYTLAGRSDLLFEARLGWRLDNLLFAGVELSAERLLAQKKERARVITGQVLKVLFDWQRARLLARDPALLPEERQRAEIDAVEAETELFVLTGGWFRASRAVK